MKNIAVTIAFNAEHHIEKSIDEHMKAFDKIIFIEGPVLPVNCTSWCKPISEEWIRNNSSVDKTLNTILEYQYKYEGRLMVYSARHLGRPFNGKIEMFNVVNRMLTDLDLSFDYIWQVDADEYWTADKVLAAQSLMADANGSSMRFLCDNFISSNDQFDFLATGMWGEGKDNNYLRLWKYQPGFKFLNHEPVVVNTRDYNPIHWSQHNIRFDHYSYFYDKDVKFKSEFYKGHEGVVLGKEKVLKELKDKHIVDTSLLFNNQGHGLNIRDSFIIKRAKT